MFYERDGKIASLRNEELVTRCPCGNHCTIFHVSFEWQSLIIRINNRCRCIITKCGFETDNWLRYISRLLHVHGYVVTGHLYECVYVVCVSDTVRHKKSILYKIKTLTHSKILRKYFVLFDSFWKLSKETTIFTTIFTITVIRPSSTQNWTSFANKNKHFYICLRSMKFSRMKRVQSWHISSYF